MHFSKNYLLTVITAGTMALAFSPPIVHERRGFVPKKRITQRRIEPETELPVRIGMTQSNLEKGHNLLMEV
jgi:tripeptidyl-peptidase-1